MQEFICDQKQLKYCTKFDIIKTVNCREVFEISVTIAACATPMQQSGIGVIRVSGDDAITIADKIFKTASGKPLANLKGYTASYGTVFDENGEFDDGVALVFKAPHSYTGEDTVEISVHGGRAVMLRTLRALFDNGAVGAGAGEFTKRAFLNGKLSLTQAEAVMDVISAEGSLALKNANTVKLGGTFKKVTEIKDNLTFAAAHLCTYIDFPEEGVQEYAPEEVTDKLEFAKSELQKLIKSYDTGAIIKSGIDCVIAGKPNVGKSTIMNLLSDTQRSIVTDIAGTTRDVVEQTVEMDGIVVRLSDTAGIRDTSDKVEQIGVEIAKSRIKNAALVLAVFDAGRPLDEDDCAMLEYLKDIAHITVVNKTDLEPKLDKNLLKSADIIEMSAKQGNGRQELVDMIKQKCGIYSQSQDGALIANERQLTAAKSALDAVSETLSALENGITFDAVTVMIDTAIGYLCELTGESVSESVVNEIFSKFCVGK